MRVPLRYSANRFARGCLLCLALVIKAELPAETLTEAASSGWSTQALDRAEEYAATIDTAAVVIVHRDQVVGKWGSIALPMKCHSIRKSFLSALYGMHVAAGDIDLDATLKQLGINDCEPSLTREELGARVKDLLSARSGVYHPALFETAAMASRRPKRGSHPPNTHWYYNNWDFNALGSIYENLTGHSLFEDFERRIAIPLGMEDFRRERDTRYVTGEDSVHPAYPFQLSTRDLAKFGQLMLHDGQCNGVQVIPESWVRESTTSYSDAGESGGYGYMWWVAVDGKHFPGVTLPEGSYSARGYRGQYLLVVPEWDLVISHRVNSFQPGTAVTKREFGKLVSMILKARPETDLAFRGSESSPEFTFDVVIRDAEVIDGTGKRRFRSDVGVTGGRITKLGDLSAATSRKTFDAGGMCVAPGFIDLHSHAEEGLVSDDPTRRSAPNLVTQGITTVVVNQDGGGPLDLIDQRAKMNRLGIGMNVVQCIGHGTIRRNVMGDDHQRPATSEELEQMQRLLRAALESGGFGLSAGLEYVPGRWSTPREMEFLAKSVAAVDGVYIVHERSSGRRPMWFLPSRDESGRDRATPPSMLDNLHELVEIASRTGVRVVATHIKARGTDFWGSSDEMNRLIQTARDEGLSIHADQYPYNTSGTDGRIVLIPNWCFQASNRGRSSREQLASATRRPGEALEAALADASLAKNIRRDIKYEITRRGGAENVLIVEHLDSSLVGKTLKDLANQLGTSPVEAAIALQLEGDRNRRGGARLRAFSMSEKDVEAFAATPWTATSSDARITLPSDGFVHPRFYGAFPRKIRHYAIDRGLFSVEEAIRVSTSLPAEILRLDDRGVIREGAVADLIVFDPQRIRDRATAMKPHQFSEGIELVLLGGVTVVEREQWLGNLVGQVITRDHNRNQHE